ncbi:DUF3592 domain-containing protein [Pontiella agarivorans]|uniref:DUF3592 domain-containing protein n=1 Tax=Pontiella agarivorans TaxID=3038953 RepID=A0ABU5MZV9_9BACT|nr:DUF3592 domain-containing protein [Pontiella agarivorans]MDZ8119704.1 DUF3592 domain-containing protein [Pontiella agarivorans]
MKRNFKYAIIWFLIGFALIKFMGWDQLADQRETAKWFKTEATVLSSDVSLDSAKNEYHLGLHFSTKVGGNIYSYTCFRNAGAKGHMDTLAETTYAPGATIAVFINPNNPSQYRFPQRAIGPWIVGFIPGVFLILIGLSVLRAKESEHD